MFHENTALLLIAIPTTLTTITIVLTLATNMTQLRAVEEGRVNLYVAPRIICEPLTLAGIPLAVSHLLTSLGYNQYIATAILVLTGVTMHWTYSSFTGNLNQWATIRQAYIFSNTTDRRWIDDYAEGDVIPDWEKDRTT